MCALEDRAGAESTGALPELAWLPIDRCYVDAGYQRSLENVRGQKLVAKIAAEFSWAKFGALLAARGEPDAAGRRWLIIDGQHRHSGALRRGDIKHVPAVVHGDLSQTEQAAAFVGANRDRLAVPAQALFHARLLAGDADACAVQRLCAAAGIAIERHNRAVKQVPAGRTASVPALLTALRVYGEAHAGAAILAVGASFGRFHGGLRGIFFLAAARFLAEGGDGDGLCRALELLGVDRLAAEPTQHSGKGGAPELVTLLRGACAATAAPGVGRALDPRRSGNEGTGPSAARVPGAMRDPPRTTDRAELVPIGPVGTKADNPPKPQTIPLGGARPPAKSAADPKRAGDDDPIARFIAEKGVTKAPPAFAAPSSAALPSGVAAKRLKEIRLREPRRPGETRAEYLARVPI